MNATTKTVSVSVGPVRIPKAYKVGLEQLKAGKDHITTSDLIREAIYLLLVKEGIIKEDTTIIASPYFSGRTEDVNPKDIVKGEFPNE